MEASCSLSHTVTGVTSDSIGLLLCFLGYNVVSSLHDQLALDLLCFLNLKLFAGCHSDGIDEEDE